MKNILINEDFNKSINTLRSILPKLSFSLLIATYLISAIIMGIFYAQKAPNIGFMVAAFLVPLAIQMGRGTLVFFFQLNPAHIQGKLSFGIIAATVLLILSIVEAYLVLSPYGISWVVSVATLMLIGWVIEVMILRETIFATQIQLFQNKEKWEEIKHFYIAKSELVQFIEEIKKGSVPESYTPTQRDQEEEQPLLPESNKAISILEELNKHLEGKGYSPSLNGQKKGIQ